MSRQHVQRADGALGWIENGVIVIDHADDMQYLAYYRRNSDVEQEDYGSPPSGWYCAAGWWQEIDATTVPVDTTTDRLSRMAAGYFG